MRVFVCFLLVLSMALGAKGQTYADSMAQYRKEYVNDLVRDRVIKASQTKNVTFFAPNKAYRVWATFTPTPGGQPFMVPTHSGKQKPFKEYGIFTFTIDGTTYKLHTYQSIDLMNDAAHKDLLFLPFNDVTNYDLTYGGGRYIDMTLNDIKNDRALIDFNKCYNPYCAFADGYSCPIPPSENKLPIEIKAGEKMFPR